MSKIRADGVYKIFGRNPERARELLQQGLSKDEIQEQTGQVVAVQDVNLEIAEGELFVVMGLSGSGKSTLVRLLNRLLETTFGTVEVNGEDVVNLSAKELRRLRNRHMAMVFQRFALFPHRTVLDNVAYGLEVGRVDRDEREQRARDALEKVGLRGWESSYPVELSGGMQQRVGLARGLATDAEILLMDEPFSALDPLIRRDIQFQLLDLQAELHKTIVFITHDLNEAMLLGDRIAVMKDGRIVQIGTAEELLTKPADDYVAAFTQDVDRSRVLTASSVMRDPVASLSPRDGPRTAVHMLQELDRRELYVLDPSRKVLGWVRDDEVSEALSRGASTLEDIIRPDFPTTDPETSINELFQLAADHRLPIAVVDDEGILQGVIPRPILLAALSQDSQEAPTPTTEGEPKVAEVVAAGEEQRDGRA